MGQLKLLTVALVAVLALGVVAASAAQAEPTLEAASYPVKVEAKGEAGSLTAGSNVITCTKNTAKGEIESPGKLGKVTITWTGCESSGSKCKSEAEGNSLKGASGEIIVETPVHLVLKVVGSHMYSFLFLVELVLIKCGILVIDITGFHGGVLLTTTLAEGTKSGTATLEGKGSGGKQEITSCEEPSELCSETGIELLSEFVEGKPESSVLAQTDSMTFSPEVTAKG